MCVCVCVCMQSVCVWLCVQVYVSCRIWLLRAQLSLFGCWSAKTDFSCRNDVKWVVVQIVCGKGKRGRFCGRVRQNPRCVHAVQYCFAVAVVGSSIRTKLKKGCFFLFFGLRFFLFPPIRNGCWFRRCAADHTWSANGCLA